MPARHRAGASTGGRERAPAPPPEGAVEPPHAWPLSGAAPRTGAGEAAAAALSAAAPAGARSLGVATRSGQVPTQSQHQEQLPSAPCAGGGRFSAFIPLRRGRGENKGGGTKGRGRCSPVARVTEGRRACVRRPLCLLSAPLPPQFAQRKCRCLPLLRGPPRP